MYHYASFHFLLFVPFQAKNDVRSAPACTALTEVSYQSHNALTTNCHLSTCKGEMNGIQRKTKVSFGRITMQALELLQLVKRHISRQNGEEIKSLAVTIRARCMWKTCFCKPAWFHLIAQEYSITNTGPY